MQENRPDSLSRIGVLVSVLAGSVGALYVAGGLLLFSRLSLQEYAPPLELVTRLPRELLISTALLAIAIPVLVVALAYLAWRSLKPRDAPPRLNRNQRRLRVVLWGAVVFTVTRAIASLAGLPGPGSWTVAAGLCLLGAALAGLALQGRNALIERSHRRGFRRSDGGWVAFGDRWTGATTATCAAVLFGAFAIPFGIMWQMFVPLRAAKVCTKHDQVIGTLIGEASDRTYLGVGPDERRLARLLSISNDEILRVFISRDDLPDAEPELRNVDCLLDPPKRRSSNPAPK